MNLALTAGLIRRMRRVVPALVAVRADDGFAVSFVSLGPTPHLARRLARNERQSRQALVDNPQQMELHERLAPSSFIAVPLSVRGRTLGAIGLARGTSFPMFDDDDLGIAREFARRAAIALDNARLHDELREADRRKDAFLATLAHELRNPLAPIRNAVILLKEQSRNREAI